MKAKINKDGRLIISVDNELEVYALKKWMEENPIPGNICIGFKLNLCNTVEYFDKIIKNGFNDFSFDV